MYTETRTHSIPLLETRRLLLRAHRLEDFPQLSSLWGDRRATQFIGNPQTGEESWGRLLRYAGHWALLGFGYWAVEEKHSGRFVGEIGFANHRRAMEPSFGDTPELGWIVSPESAGQGYATEAAKAALDWGRMRWRLQRVTCIMNPDHQKSAKVATKCGFQRVGEAAYKNSRVAVFEQWFVENPDGCR